MRRQIIIIIALVVALVASNAWWAFRLIDAGITQAYMSDSLKENKQALSQTLAILPVVAQGASRDKIVSAARTKGVTTAPFEKDGFVWVGWIGLKFDQNGKLIKVERVWSPP